MRDLKENCLRKSIPLNNDWEFTLDFNEGVFDLNNTKGFSKVRIPHTMVETPFNYFDEGIYQHDAAYRKTIEILEEWKGRRIALKFDGVAHRAVVYLNGERLYENLCGYTSFEVDITSKAIYGKKNTIVVEVDSRENQNIPPFGYVIDYMTYGGIYREVSLEISGMLHFKDLYAIPTICSDIKKETKTFKEASCRANLKLQFSLSDSLIDNTYKETCHAKIELKLIDDKEIICLRNYPLLDYINSDFLANLKEGTALIEEEIDIEKIRPWDVTYPKLYTLVCELKSEDLTLDVWECKIGFRKAEFREDGFYLNDRKLRIRGLNRHQSYPYVGYAMPESMQRLDAEILRFELGVNAVRTSHYPQSKAFINRCDELGLLVFTEIPGWQHIGDEAWKNVAIENVANMVTQYRNHASIILWGVRINESVDDDEFYKKTNAVARKLDSSRATAGVRYLKNSSLLEDVYTYNDFSHDGTNAGCEPKKKVTSNRNKAYIISEFNGHMFPTKSYDSEEHRLEHAIRHAKVLNDFYKNEDIAGAFGWCMFDYNTHKDFGSGDRICYHGVMDMFRNSKLAAYVYEAMQGVRPVLEVSSSFDIGEHPAGSRGNTYIFTNCDSVKMYKNDIFIKEYTHKDSPFKNLKNGPILVDDYVGDIMLKEEKFSKKQNDTVKKCLNYVARFGMNHLPAEILLEAGKALTIYRMTFADAYALYQKYVGNWGGTSTAFRFEGYKDGKKVLTVTKKTSSKLHLELDVSSTNLVDDKTYDVAAIRVKVKDENNNLACFFNDSLPITISGEGLEIIGPKKVKILGGMGGTYLKTRGVASKTKVRIDLPEEWSGIDTAKELEFNIEC